MPGTVSNGQLKALNMELLELLKEECDSVAFAHKLGHAIEVLGPHLAALDKSEKKIFQDFADKNEDGTVKVLENNRVRVTEEQIEAYSMAMDELYNFKFELNPMPISFTKAEFKEAGVSFSVARAIRLGPLVK